MDPTIAAYSEWQTAYTHFNRRLFSDELPSCLITLDTKAKHVLGYFVPQRFIGASEETVDQLAMNPKHFLRRTVTETLSTFVHEMCHVWTYHYGKMKNKRFYHNEEWAQKMESVGLMPSSTGLPGGKKTGKQLSHYMIEGGPFEKVRKELLAENFRISWAERPAPQKNLLASYRSLMDLYLSIPSPGTYEEKNTPASSAARPCGVNRN
jgi:hypothetical protein